MLSKDEIVYNFAKRNGLLKGSFTGKDLGISLNEFVNRGLVERTLKNHPELYATLNRQTHKKNL